MTNKTMDALWAEYKPRKVQGKKTETEIIRQYERYVAPVLGAKRVDKITYEQIDDMMRNMRETPYQANRVLALLRAMFKFAIHGLRWTVHNPCVAVTAFPERKRKRHLKKAEAPRIAKAITAREASSPDGALFLWMLIFTGARPSELYRATWADLEGNVITLDDHKSVKKTGLERVIVLPPAAMEKLNYLKPVEERRPQDKIIGIKFPWFVWRTMRVECKCPDLRVYDLRHTFGSYALERGFTLGEIGQALNHADPKTTAIYAELTDKNRNRVAQHTSLAILADMELGETDYSHEIRELG